MGIDSSDLRLWGSRLRRMDREPEPFEGGELIEFDVPGEGPVRLLVGGVEVDGVIPLIADPEHES